MINQTSLNVWRNETKARAPLMQKKILAAIEELQPCCNQEIAEHLKLPINSVTGRVKELREQKKVVYFCKMPYKWGRTVNYWATLGYKEREYPDD